DIELGGDDDASAAPAAMENLGMPKGGFRMPMGLEDSPLRMPYDNPTPGSEVEWQVRTGNFPGRDARQPADAVAWSEDPASMSFPTETPVSGMLLGSEFRPDHAVLRESGLGAWELT